MLSLRNILNKLHFTKFNFLTLNVMYIGLVVALVLVSQKQILVNKAAGNPTFTVSPLAVTPMGTYTVTLSNHTNYSGPLKVISWICDSRTNSSSSRSCSTPKEYNPWMCGSSPCLMANNKLTINLASLGGIPEKIYYAKFAVPNEAYSNTIQQNVTRYAYPVNANMSTLAQKSRQLMSKLVNEGNIENIPGTGTVINGVSYNTLAGITKATASANDSYTSFYVNAIQNICGGYPSSTHDDKATWHACAAVYSYILINYYIYEKNDLPRAQALSYSLINMMDVLSSSASYPSELSLSDTSYNSINYQFLDAHENQYINDVGLGVFQAFGWHKAKISRYYCTPVEKPFDAGKNCKTIDLYSRIAKVASNVALRTPNDKRSDTNYLAWNSVGRSVEVKVSGHPNLNNVKKTLIQDAQKYLALEYTVPRSIENYQNPLPLVKPIISAEDHFQKLGTLIAVTDYIPAQAQINESLNWADVFLKGFYDFNYPLAKANYDPSTKAITGVTDWYYRPSILALWSTPYSTPPDYPALVSCGSQSGVFWTPNIYSDNVYIVGQRGERVSDTVLSGGPDLYITLLASGNEAYAQEVFDITNRYLDLLNSQSLFAVAEEKCNPSNVHKDTPKTDLSVRLRQYAQYLFTYNVFNKTPLSSYYTP
jgi:hypothetical protein